MALIPAVIGAGLTFEERFALESYPAPSWALTLLLRGAKAVDMSATAVGAEHQFTALAAESATWPAGVYQYSLRATQGGDVREVESGTLTVREDLSVVADGFDARSQNRIALDSINAVLAKRATMDQQRYSINNRELWRTPIPELLKLRAFYSVQVRREQSGGRFGRNIPVRFS